MDLEVCDAEVIATHSSSSSMQVWWAKLKDFGPLHAPKFVQELCFLFFLECFSSSSPDLNIAVILLENSTSLSLGFNFKMNPEKRGLMLLYHLIHNVRVDMFFTMAHQNCKHMSFKVS